MYEFGLPIGGRKCAPNALPIFTDYGRKTVATLHKDEPWLFADLFDHDYERVPSHEGVTSL